MSACHSKVVVDYEGDLSPSQKPTSFWAFCSSRLTFLNWEFWMILFRAKFGRSFPSADREDFSSSKESTISTSLIHSISIRWRIKTGSDLCFESNFLHQERLWIGEFVELQFQYLLSLVTDHEVLR